MADADALRLAGFIALWYAFNAGFNVTNKQILNQFNFAWVVSWLQLATGLVFVLPAWATGLRVVPRVDARILRAFVPIALLHAGGHVLQVSAMGAGSVYFTHVIKASEPLVGVAVAFVATGKLAPWYVILTLVPIVGGVAYAAAKPGATLDLGDLASYPSLAALGSTVAFAIAKLFAKQLMTPEMKKSAHLDAANNYAVLTCCSATVLLPVSLAFEGTGAFDEMRRLITTTSDASGLLRRMVVCGALYYSYNEMGFRVLDLQSPVSQAVTNSAKRVVVLFAAVVFLGEEVSRRKLQGSAVAMAGVLAYSLAKVHADARAKAKKAK